MVFGWFSKESKLARMVKAATTQHGQQIDRWNALQELDKDGSDAAILGLLRRLSVTTAKLQEDDEEKSWVVDRLVARGDKTLELLPAFMKGSLHWTRPLGIIERIGGDKARALADELFRLETPGYTRDPERRIDLIRWFADWKAIDEKAVASTLGPYLPDFDENVRAAAIEGISARNARDATPALIAALIRPEEESGRIKRRLCALLAAWEAPLGDRANDVQAVLRGSLDAYRVEAGRLVGPTA